jgi:hypothetical protein
MEFRIKALPKYYLHWLPTTCILAPQNYQQALVFKALLWRAEYRMVLVIWGEEVRVGQILERERSTKLCDEFRYGISVVLPTWIYSWCLQYYWNNVQIPNCRPHSQQWWFCACYSWLTEKESFDERPNLHFNIILCLCGLSCKILSMN